MTWPTTTTTDNVDAARDNPVTARTDILKNVQDTNAIIATFPDVDLSLAPIGSTFTWTGTGWNTITTSAPWEYYGSTISLGQYSQDWSGVDGVSLTADGFIDTKLAGNKNFITGNLSNNKNFTTGNTLAAGTWDLNVTGLMAIDDLQAARTINPGPGETYIDPTYPITINNTLLTMNNATAATVIATYTPAVDTIDQQHGGDKGIVFWVDLSARLTITEPTVITFTATTDIDFNSDGNSAGGTTSMTGLLLLKVVNAA